MRAKIWAVSFDRLAQDGQPNTLYVKARGPEDAVRRAIADAIDSEAGICPDNPEYLLGAGIEAEQLPIVSVMAEAWTGPLDMSIVRNLSEVDGEDDDS